MTYFSIIAYHYSNEDTLLRFINNIKFVDDILIIDFTNNISTLFLKENPTIKVLTIDSKLLSEIEIIAKNCIKNNWYLSLKTSYLVSIDLISEIDKIDQSNDQVSYFSKRKFYFLQSEIKFGLLERSYFPLFLNKKNKSKNRKNLKNKILNKPLPDIDLYNDSINKISKSEGNELLAANFTPTLINFLLYPFFFLIYHFIITGGFLNGKKGFALVYFHTFGLIKKYLFVWIKQKEIN